MPEIQLNKPLYKETSGAAREPAGPRLPRPPVMARVGALLIDMLFLHLICFIIIRLMPGTIVSLGAAGQVIGFAVGFAYFAVGSSHLMRGQTIGKLVLKMRVCDIAGPELPIGRAFVREAVLLWPLALLGIMLHLSETRVKPGDISLWDAAPVSGIMALGGWFIGSALFAWADRGGQAPHDRVARSTVIAVESPVELQSEFLRQIRAGFEPKDRRMPLIALSGTVAVFVGLTAVLLYFSNRFMNEMPADLREIDILLKRGTALEGFARPRLNVVNPKNQKLAPGAQQAKDTQTSTTFWYQYRRRGPIDAEALKQNPHAMNMPERLTELYRQVLLKAQPEQRPGMIPPRPSFKVSFAELPDLFFAWQHRDVLAISKDADFSDLVTTAAASANTPQMTGTETTTTSP